MIEVPSILMIKYVKRTAIEYFKNVYISENQLQEGNLFNGIKQIVDTQINADLTRPIKDEEILKAVFSMHPDKAPEPDGLTPGFYQQHWSTIKSGVCSSIRNFFNTAYLDPNMNATYICLIQKIHHPQNYEELQDHF